MPCHVPAVQLDLQALLAALRNSGIRTGSRSGARTILEGRPMVGLKGCTVSRCQRSASTPATHWPTSRNPILTDRPLTDATAGPLSHASGGFALAHVGGRERGCSEKKKQPPSTDVGDTVGDEYSPFCLPRALLGPAVPRAVRVGHSHQHCGTAMRGAHTRAVHTCARTSVRLCRWDLLHCAPAVSS